MKASFPEAKDIALAAIYETLYYDADYESVKVSAIHKRIDGVYSQGYLRRALRALANDDLVKIDHFEDAEDYFSLTDQGVVVADDLVSAKLQTARFLADQQGEDISIPASDRIVLLSDNQARAVEEPLSQLITAVEVDNGNPDFPGLREMLIGQLKAGRELILARQVRAYLLYEVLVKALNELIKRYGNPTIAALANALLGAIVSNMMQV